MLLLALGVLLSVSASHEGDGTMYHNTWAVHVRGDRSAADRVAQATGFVNLGQVRDRVLLSSSFEFHDDDDVLLNEEEFEEKTFFFLSLSLHFF